MEVDEKDIEIAQLKWILAALILKCENAESEATVILPARSLGIYTGFCVDVEVTEGDNYASVVHVKVYR
jgi:hypothetical protein